MVSTSDSTWKRGVRGSAVQIVIVILSLVVPITIIIVSIQLALSGKPLGFGSADYQYYGGPVKDGALWRLSLRQYRNFELSGVYEHRLIRLDLSTGVESDTGAVIKGAFCAGVWFKDELYFYTGTAIYKVAGQSVVTIATAPKISGILASRPFAYNDQLTMFVRNSAGRYHLIHLQDGKWVSGRSVLFPEPGRFWYRDPQRDRLALYPITSAPPAGRARIGSQMSLTVVQQNEQVHLFIDEYPSFSAYRNGIEFVDEPTDAPSALSPENSIPEVSGWESIQATDGAHRYDRDQMACDRYGPIFSTRGPSNPMSRYVRRTADGQLETLTGPDNYRPVGHAHLCADPSSSIAYIVDDENNWGRVTIRRIEGNVIHPVHLTLPGHSKAYLARWKCVLVGLFVAWMIHLAITIGGTMWLTQSEIVDTYVFGNQQAELASVGRRAMALFVDFSIVLAISTGFLFLGLNWPHRTDRELCDHLLEMEKMIANVNFPGAAPTMSKLLESWRNLVLPEIGDPSVFFLCVGSTFGLLLLLRIIQEGRHGITPGKWLFGIRTVCVTLRPCGMGRSLVRTILYWIDLSGLLTPLPAAVCLMQSRHRQRLGDHVADTIVIRSGSIRNSNEDAA